MYLPSVMIFFFKLFIQNDENNELTFNEMAINV